MNNVKHITSMEFAQGLIESASPAQLRDMCSHISVRLFALEKQTSGMKSSNLNEAANFVADAVRDIQGAISAPNDEPCTCGRCDECVVSRSDQQYDRARDALVAERTAAGRAA